jgi:hypothetical protein
MTSSGIALVPSFMLIGHLVQKLKSEDTDAPTDEP